ncbi:MAG: four helix bundle protein [Ferruginibacter sp.]
MHNFLELKIWQRSMDLVVEVYRLSLQFPAEEKYGLVAQLRRAAVSIPSNISEGAGRSSNKEFKHFLEYAMGSCNELQTQIELAKRFEYLQPDIGGKIIDEALQLYKMILGFYKTL